MSNLLAYVYVDRCRPITTGNGSRNVGTIEDYSHKGMPLERLRAANCYQRYAEAVHFQTDGK